MCFYIWNLTNCPKNHDTNTVNQHTVIQWGNLAFVQYTSWALFIKKRLFSFLKIAKLPRLLSDLQVQIIVSAWSHCLLFKKFHWKLDLQLAVLDFMTWCDLKYQFTSTCLMTPWSLSSIIAPIIPPLGLMWRLIQLRQELFKVVIHEWYKINSIHEHDCTVETGKQYDHPQSYDERVFCFCGWDLWLNSWNRWKWC